MNPPGVLLITARYVREGPAQRSSFHRPQVYERVRISLVEVYERVEKSFRSIERPKRLTHAFYRCEKDGENVQVL